MSITREQLEGAAQLHHVHPDHAAKLLGEFGITVAPPPPPQKSANQREAEKMVKLIRDGMEVQFTHPADRGRIVLLRHISEANEHAVTLMREYITAALDARDAEHRQRLAEKDHEMRGELEALRGACSDLLLQGGAVIYSGRVLNIPLTKSERSAAK
jgi:hypothetical protein